MIIYRHSASKEDLYLAAVRRSAARPAEAVDELRGEMAEEAYRQSAAEGARA